MYLFFLFQKPVWVPPPGVDVSRPYKDPTTGKLIDPATGDEIDIDLSDKKTEKAALKIQVNKTFSIVFKNIL